MKDRGRVAMKKTIIASLLFICSIPTKADGLDNTVLVATNKGGIHYAYVQKLSWTIDSTCLVYYTGTKGAYGMLDSAQVFW